MDERIDAFLKDVQELKASRLLQSATTFAAI
jgi:hypothetical protein